MDFLAQKLTADVLYSAALTLTCLLIWLYAIYIWIRAKTITHSYNAATTVAEYEPPKDISPILAHYLLSFGAEVRIAGDMSKTGEQLMLMICLYERGLLSDLTILDGRPMRVQYQVSNDYATLTASEEEKMFVNRLVSTGGTQGQMVEQIKGGGPKTPETPDGFDIINKFWFGYWYKDLQSITAKLNLTSSKNKNYYFLATFALTVTFGAFFALWLFIASGAFPPLAYLGFLLILPQTLLYLLCVLLLSVLTNLNGTLGLKFVKVLNLFPAQLLLILIFFSWFGWMLIFGTQVRKLYFRFSDSGRVILQKLKGYKLYLQEVDANRIDILHKSENSKVNSTTLPWLLVFKIFNFQQWQQWKDLEPQKDTGSLNTATKI